MSKEWQEFVQVYKDLSPLEHAVFNEDTTAVKILIAGGEDICLKTLKTLLPSLESIWTPFNKLPELHKYIEIGLVSDKILNLEPIDKQILDYLNSRTNKELINELLLERLDSLAMLSNFIPDEKFNFFAHIQYSNKLNSNLYYKIFDILFALTENYGFDEAPQYQPIIVCPSHLLGHGRPLNIIEDYGFNVNADIFYPSGNIFYVD